VIFLRVIDNVALCQEICNREIRNVVSVEPLLGTEGSQPQWFGHVAECQKRVHSHVLLTTSTGKLLKAGRNSNAAGLHI